MTDVFLSYQHEDRAWLERVDAALRAAGITTWWDRRVRAGEDWDDEIRDHLEGARCVVVLWSERSWRSRWVQAEAHDAFNRDALVPARLDDVRLRVPFNKTQAEDLRPDGGLARLVEAVRAHLAGEGPKVAGRTPVPAPVRHQMAVIAAPEDRNRVVREVAVLRQQGFEVFDEAPGDVVLSEAMQAAIGSAHEVMVFWSAAARRDPGVAAQLGYARQVAAARSARGEAGAEGFFTTKALDDTDLPAELTTKPGAVGAVVWLMIGVIAGTGTWAWRSEQATAWSWGYLGLAAALTVGVGLLQVMRRGDRLLRAGRVYAAGRWLDRATAVELIAASEAFLDRIFGARVLSLRAFAVSATVSLLSVAPVIAVWWWYFRDAGLAGGMSRRAWQARQGLQARRGSAKAGQVTRLSLATRSDLPGP